MKLLSIIFALVFITSPSFCQKEMGLKKQNCDVTIGLELDAFPYLSGGYYGSMWLGLKQQNIRLRPIIAKANVPSFMLNKGIKQNTIMVYAFVLDYFFKPDYKGLWIAPGIEYWDGKVKSSNNFRSNYNQWILTAGGGYVWKFYGNLYLNPWIAGHYSINRSEKFMVGGTYFKPARFIPEASIKIGWHF